MSVDRLLDTDFLISRWQGGEGAAVWLEANTDLRLGIPWVVKGEFLIAADRAGQDVAPVRKMLERYPTLWPDDELVAIYAALASRSVSAGQQPPANLFWIAASAVRAGVPIVTRRLEVFRGIAGFSAEAF